MTEKKKFTKEVMLRRQFTTCRKRRRSAQLVKFQRNKRKSVWWSLGMAIFQGLVTVERYSGRDCRRFYHLHVPFSCGRGSRRKTTVRCC